MHYMPACILVLYIGLSHSHRLRVSFMNVDSAKSSAVLQIRPIFSVCGMGKSRH